MVADVKEWLVESMEHDAWIIEAETAKEAADQTVWDGETLGEEVIMSGTMIYFDVFHNGENVDGRCVWLKKDKDGDREDLPKKSGKFSFGVDRDREPEDQAPSQTGGGSGRPTAEAH